MQILIYKNGGVPVAITSNMVLQLRCGHGSHYCHSGSYSRKWGYSVTQFHDIANQTRYLSGTRHFVVWDSENNISEELALYIIRVIQVLLHALPRRSTGVLISP